MLAQGPVDLRHHEAHHRNGGVIDTVLLARLGVEGGEEVFVEVEHRVGTVAPGKQRGVDRVDGLHQHVERGTEQGEDLLLRQRPERGAQQGVGALIEPPMRILPHLAAALPGEQKSEGEGLGEGVGEQPVLVLDLEAGILGVGEQRVAELGPHIGQGRRGVFAAGIAHHVAYQAGSVRQGLSHLLRRREARRLGKGECGDDVEERLQVEPAQSPGDGARR